MQIYHSRLRQPSRSNKACFIPEILHIPPPYLQSTADAVPRQPLPPVASPPPSSAPRLPASSPVEPCSPRQRIQPTTVAGRQQTGPDLSSPAPKTARGGGVGDGSFLHATTKPDVFGAGAELRSPRSWFCFSRNLCCSSGWVWGRRVVFRKLDLLLRKA